MASAEAQWKAFCGRIHEMDRGMLDGPGEVIGARAPGRLDVMGGIADYSGSVVLESTLNLATFAAVQKRPDDVIRIRSAAPSGGRQHDHILGLSEFMEGGSLAGYAAVRERLTAARESRWAAYIGGCLYVLLAEGKLAPSAASGLNIVVESSVPIGAGVSSSAALEVAVMTSITRLFNLTLEPVEVSRLCQTVENRVVGAPCGIMDQVTCAMGRENTVLALKCQPHEVLGYEPLPPGWRLAGIDSGTKHSVGGGAYGRARVAAFMGFAIVRQLTGRGWNGYLCNMDPDSWAEIRAEIPEHITGEEFTRRYGPHGDPVSQITPDETYRPCACAEHPVLENARVREFLSLVELAQKDSDSGLLAEAGRLMLEAHRSYSERVDLGCAETDMLVELAMAEGPSRGVYGAKITGGGSGGTVAILYREGCDDAVERIHAEYGRRTGKNTILMRGSSPGAAEFGARAIPL
jgi:galactokinase